MSEQIFPRRFPKVGQKFLIVELDGYDVSHLSMESTVILRCFNNFGTPIFIACVGTKIRQLIQRGKQCGDRWTMLDDEGIKMGEVVILFRF